MFAVKNLRDQILPYHKIRQGQPKVIIYIILIVLESQMLNNTFQGNRLSGSGEDDF